MSNFFQQNLQDCWLGHRVHLTIRCHWQTAVESTAHERSQWGRDCCRDF